MLLEAGADPDLADGEGVTPLARETARASGQTPLSPRARFPGYDAIAALLVAAGRRPTRAGDRQAPEARGPP